MAVNPLVDSRDVRFVLFELLKVDSLARFEKFSEFDRETMEASLDLAEQIAVNIVFPANIQGDKEGGVRYVPDTKEVHVPECYRPALKAYHDAGFLALPKEQEIGGVGMPEIIFQSSVEYFSAASLPFTMYTHLSFGTINLIKNFGTPEQKGLYLEKIISGEWGSTMCLTEPGAGSDVGALTTKAVRQPDGTYLITGQKIFITNGDTDLYENIIHPVLARIEGDPPGTKGISIFLVPKYRVNPDGSMGEQNDVICTGVEHKMGLKSSATCAMSFGDNGNCVGTLLGEERKGMRIMFQMINESRLYVGIQALAVSGAAYLHAVTYSRNRVQGGDITRKADPSGGPVAIIKHPDMKRMLIWMKSHVEAMRILCYYIGYLRDVEFVAEGDEAREAEALVDFLTPIGKGGNSDLSWLITGEAIQVFGGYGFCADYPVELFARDSKIQSIYEGTNSIQAMDLLMRKLLQDSGQYRYGIYKARIRETVERARGVVNDRYISPVEDALRDMDALVEDMKVMLERKKIPQLFFQAKPLLNAFRYLTHGWMHLWSLTVTEPKMLELVGDVEGEILDSVLEDSPEASFYTGKVLASRFFIGTEMKKFAGEMAYLRSEDTTLLRVQDEIFTGAPLE